MGTLHEVPTHHDRGHQANGISFFEKLAQPLKRSGVIPV
jgi:hypothetical protein